MSILNLGLNNLLRTISKFVSDERARQNRVAVVFDLDSTLFCVSPRSTHILHSLGAAPEFQQAHPEVAAVLREIEVLPTDWGVKSAVQRARIQGEMSLFVKIRDYWREHFFSDHHLHHDRVYPGALEYVRHLHDIGADIMYLTGRSQTRMRVGTLAALKKWGFPLLEERRLMMKPDEVQPDEGFKVVRLKEILAEYPHVWFFENEPVIIERVRQELPNVRIVFVNTVHSGKGQPPQDLLTISGDYQWPSS